MELLFNFGIALSALRDEKRVTREGWNGEDMWIKIEWTHPNSTMTQPYIYMCTAQGDLIPWLASQTDMLAQDWMRVD